MAVVIPRHWRPRRRHVSTRGLIRLGIIGEIWPIGLARKVSERDRTATCSVTAILNPRAEATHFRACYLKQRT